MSRKIVSKFALVLALAVLALSNHRFQAQSPSTPPPTVVTGSDPQPGQPTVSTTVLILSILIATIRS